jgi:hypothetical protein
LRARGRGARNGFANYEDLFTVRTLELLVHGAILRCTDKPATPANKPRHLYSWRIVPQSQLSGPANAACECECQRTNSSQKREYQAD